MYIERLQHCYSHRMSSSSPERWRNSNLRLCCSDAGSTSIPDTPDAPQNAAQLYVALCALQAAVALPHIVLPVEVMADLLTVCVMSQPAVPQELTAYSTWAFA